MYQDTAKYCVSIQTFKKDLDQDASWKVNVPFLKFKDITKISQSSFRSYMDIHKTSAVDVLFYPKI